MLVEAREQLYVKTDNKEIVKELKSYLNKPNPEYAKKMRMGLAVYNVPPRIIMYEQKGDWLLIPRGTGRLARELAEKYEEPFELKDFRTDNVPINVNMNEGIVPFWYQNEAYEVMVEKQQGMVEAPCGAGKSVVGLLFICRQKQAALIIVHTKELFNQWLDEIQKNINGRFKLGQIGSGKRKHGDITVAMVQTLIRFSPKEWAEIKKRYAIVITDEAHHAGANSYMLCMQNVQAKYSIGLTATPKRKDGKTFIVHNYLGPVIHKITYNDLEVSGRAVSCKINMVKTGRSYNFTKMGENYAVLGAVMAKDKERNKIIVNKTRYDIDEGRKPLLLTERVYQAKFLQSLLRSQGYKVEKIIGDSESHVRDLIKTKMKNGELDALIASKQIAAEGLDIPNVDSIHVCFWTSNKALVKQMIGRGRRVYGDKTYCRVWVYKDTVLKVEVDHELNERMTEVPGFRYQFLSLRKYFRDQSFDVNEIESGDEINIL